MAKARELEFQKHVADEFGEHEGQGRGQLV